MSHTQKFSGGSYVNPRIIIKQEESFKKIGFHTTQGAATASEYVGGASRSWDKIDPFSCGKL